MILKSAAVRSRPKYSSLYSANNKLFNEYHKLRPATVDEIKQMRPGTGTKTLVTMLNEGPKNDQEREILEYFIWTIAIPRIKLENFVAKLEMEEIADLEDGEIDTEEE